MGTPWAARRKNDDSPRNLRYLTFSESFHWLIAKTQTQEPIRSLENLETRFFFRAILANQRHGKRANGYFGCTESATSKLQVPDADGVLHFYWKNTDTSIDTRYYTRPRGTPRPARHV